jgi:biopolymer transport protein ExbD
MALKINKGRSGELFNFTPMIDVVFNLLIFFMVATRFAEEERSLEVELPTASEAMPLTAKPREIYINIDDQGRFFVGNQQVTAAEMDALLLRASRDNPLNQSVVIRADKRVPWDAVATAMNACVKAGIRDYTAATAEN